MILSDGWRGELVDASITGLRVRSLLVLGVGDPIEVTLVLGENERVDLRGRVAWVKPADFGAASAGDFGVALADAPPAYLALVRELFADM